VEKFVDIVIRFVDIVIRFVDITVEVVGIYIIVDTRILFVDSVKRFVGIQSHNCKHDKPTCICEMLVAIFPAKNCNHYHALRKINLRMLLNMLIAN